MISARCDPNVRSNVAGRRAIRAATIANTIPPTAENVCMASEMTATEPVHMPMDSSITK